VTVEPILADRKSPIRVRLHHATKLRSVFVDERGRPVPNIAVRVSWLGGNAGHFPARALNLPGFSARTNAAGIAILRGLPRPQQVRLDVDDSRFAQMGTADTLLLRADQPVQTRRIRLLPELSIAGRITFAPGGKPAPGIGVWANYLNPNKPLEAGTDIMEYGGGGTRTGADGQYRIAGLRPGAYRIGVGVQGTPWTTAYRNNVVLRPARPIDNVDFSLARGALVTGRVVNARTGEPIQGVWVGGGPASAGVRDYVSWGLSNAEGVYRVRVPAGRALIHLRGGQRTGIQHPARRGDYIRQTIEVRDGQTASLDFQVAAEPYESITGRDLERPG
jgi:hypothetical protein